jgi:GntR family transcriptional regulator
MPEVRRAEPPYVQIASHYRDLILRGELAEGDQLPAVADIGKEWGVSPSTAARSIGQLSVERYVRVLARGTFVEPLQHGSGTPQDRITRTRSGQLAAPEMVIVRAAELIRIPVYVAELMNLDAAGQVIRREWVACAGRRPQAEPVGLYVTWHAPDLAESVPELLMSRPIPDGAAALIERATGRTVEHGEDHFHGRASDQREASALGVPVGSPILAGAYLWTAGDGLVIEYGEFCLPERRTVRYDYSL